MFISNFHLVPITVTLSPPSPKAAFTNKRAELECLVTAQDWATLSTININWFINGHKVADIIPGQTNGIKKTSTLTRSLNDWKSVNKVSCSAEREHMMPITQTLTVNKGMLTDPHDPASNLFNG